MGPIHTRDRPFFCEALAQREVSGQGQDQDLPGQERRTDATDVSGKDGEHGGPPTD